jgi:Ca2+-binding EF-hand superfamily protein
MPPVMEALDANGDGTIDEWEVSNATALLRKLDRNNDGRLTPEELRPALRDRGGAPGNQPQRRPRRPEEPQ